MEKTPTEPLDPYAPPTVRAVTLPPDDRVGHGWWVEGGRLWLKDRSSLPNVCVLGGPEGSAGRRISVDVAHSFFRRLLAPALALLFFLAVSLGISLLILSLLILGITLGLQMLTSVRAILFVSDGKRGRYLLEALGPRLVIAAACLFAFHLLSSATPPALQPGGDLRVLLFAVGLVLVAVAATAPFGLRTVRKGEWRELRGVAPACIRRLEQIQGEQKVPLVKPGERPSPA